MVNNTREITTATRLVTAYVAIVTATLIALVVLSVAGSDQATSSAWVHGVIVAVFAVLLPLRLRSARAGSAPAVLAVGIIATVLTVVNLVEALLPGAFPVWMRVEMVVIAVMMGTVATVSLRARR